MPRHSCPCRCGHRRRQRQHYLHDVRLEAILGCLAQSNLVEAMTTEDKVQPGVINTDFQQLDLYRGTSKQMATFGNANENMNVLGKSK